MNILERIKSFAVAAVIMINGSLLASCGGEVDLPAEAPPVSIAQQPLDQSVTAGGTATFSVTVSGGNTSLQWQTFTNGSWTNISGATATTYVVSNATQGQSGTQYRVMVTSGALTVVSSPATLTVTVVVISPAVTVPPADAIVTEPATATFNVTATGTAPLTYQWQRGVTGTFTNIAGATAATYVTPATVRASDNGTQFRVILTNSAGTATSAAATLTVNPAPVAPAFTTQPADITVTAPTTATFTVAATGTPSPTLQWQISTDSGATWNDVSTGTGATSVTYTTEATSVPMSARRYRAVATNSTGTAISNSAVLTVNPTPVAPSITSQPADQSVFSPATASFTVAATGTPSPTFQWQRSDDAGVTWAGVVGATGTTYTTPATTGGDNGARFRVVVANSAGSVTSNVALLSVNTPVAPAFTLQPALQEVTGGAQITFTVTATGGPTPALQWQRTDDGGATWNDIAAATGASYSFNPVRADDGAEFRAVATNSAGTATSNAARFNNLATMAVLTSVGGAGGGVSTPAFTRFGGAGLDGAGNFLFNYSNTAGTEVVRTIVPTTGSVSDTVTVSTGLPVGGMAVSPGGDLYMANFSNIRLLNTSNVQSNFATGYPRVTDGVAFSSGSLFLTDVSTCVVHAITVPGAVQSVLAGTSGNCSTQADGTGSAARFRNPTGLALDATTGNLMVCDNFLGSPRLASITPAGVVTTVNSSGAGAAIGDPTRLIACDWLTADTSGNVYFLSGTNVLKRRPNGVTAIVGRLSSSVETRILQWSPSGYLAVGNGGSLVRLDLR